MKITPEDEKIFAEILEEKWANFLLELAKIFVEKEFEKIPQNSVKNPENPVISLKIEVRKQKTSLRTKVDFDIF